MNKMNEELKRVVQSKLFAYDVGLIFCAPDSMGGIRRCPPPWM